MVDLLLWMLQLQGGYLQLSSGKMQVDVPQSPTNALPLMRVDGLVELNGQIKVIRQPDVAILEGTKWQFLSALNGSALDVNLSAVSGPVGTDMAIMMTKDGSLPVFLLAVDSVDCQYIVNYSMNSSTGASTPCQVCLKASNQGCQWCHDRCLPRDSADAASFSSCNLKNCCPQQCNGHGTCHYASDQSPYCVCSWLYAGEVSEALSREVYASPQLLI